MILNTFDQLKAAGGGVAIITNYGGIRDRYVDGWAIIRVVNGKVVTTDPKAPWYHRDTKVFLMRPRNSDDADTFAVRRKAAFETAATWVAKTYGVQGPWKRNRLGDFVLADIQTRFPIKVSR